MKLKKKKKDIWLFDHVRNGRTSGLQYVISPQSHVKDHMQSIWGTDPTSTAADWWMMAGGTPLEGPSTFNLIQKKGQVRGWRCWINYVHVFASSSVTSLKSASTSLGNSCMGFGAKCFYQKKTKSKDIVKTLLEAGETVSWSDDPVGDTGWVRCPRTRRTHLPHSASRWVFNPTGSSLKGVKKRPEARIVAVTSRSWSKK